MENPKLQAEKSFCSKYSLQAGENLYGTATPTRNYILVEASEPWGAKALAESQIPKKVKDQLKTVSKNLPDTKVLLIKREKSERAMRHLYIAVCDVKFQALYSFPFSDYTDLEDFDFSPLQRGELSAYESQRSQQSLVLICTNGRRDKCCAKFGLPVYQALHQSNANNTQIKVWQSSHVGGHRFATNVLVLPHGWLYGRVNITGASQILQGIQNDQMVLEYLRGITTLPRFAQAAEYHLRSSLGILDRDAIRFQSSTKLNDNQWEILFTEPQNNRLHKLILQHINTPVEVYDGCSFDKTTVVTNYELISHQEMEIKQQ